MPIEKVFSCATVQETQALAERMAASFAPPLIVFLSGDLGSGKTTFARSALQALGYRGKVKSPTYTLVEEYSLGHIDVFHFDFYRFTDIMDFESIGGRDYFRENSICLIEWPERINEILPKADICLYFSYTDNGRSIRIQSNNNINI